MLKSLLRMISRHPESVPLEKLVKDKYGNELPLCVECKVPVARRGAVVRCMNGCIHGHVDYVRNEDACAENDYNPRVLSLCGGCQGDGRTYFKEGEDWCAQQCAQCDGKGTFFARKFSDEEQEVLARAVPLTVDQEGWTKCPKCNFKFLVTDPNVWLDDRHKRCGQKLLRPPSANLLRRV